MNIELKPHNLEAYNRVKEKFETNNKAAIIHPTGTGKSYIAMKLIEENPDKKVIYLSPSRGILLQLKTPNGQVIKMTYQKLAKLDDEQIKKLGIDIIVLDEFHHCGAPIWGEAVQKLNNAFPNAKVLGLSATPIRYFDGNVDMAEEMFGNDIVSEISFEEAIERGILPEFDYVSALYGVNESLEKLKNLIENSNSAASKKEEANRLYYTLKKNIEKNAENLPNIIKKHIPNPTGKYIVFCRNIEDLENKVEEVRRLFGQVNDNIEINTVSSDETQQKNERNIKQFTNNKNPKTLKLMFAVNMLNEGFHLPDIDGVIMMRPTMSPTIFQQQMGRALSVGSNGKRPVVIDLVDNFNTIQVIEDFSKRMRGIEPKGIPSDTYESERKIKLYDYLKDMNQIINKIEKLARKNSLTMDEKIELFQKYLEDENTTDKIIQDTIYEGYPIGLMLASIRSDLNNNTKNYKITDEQKAKLESLGLLDKIHESTIDEKINRLIDFVQKYPDLWDLKNESPETIELYINQKIDKVIGIYLNGLKNELKNEEKANNYSVELEYILEDAEKLEQNDAFQEGKISALTYIKEHIQKELDLSDFKNNYPKELELYVEILNKEITKSTDPNVIRNNIIGKIKQQLDLTQKDYKYIISRKSKGKIDDTDLKRFKEDGVGGVFGYTKEQLDKRIERFSDYIINNPAIWKDNNLLRNGYKKTNLNKEQEDLLLEADMKLRIAKVDYSVLASEYKNLTKEQKERLKYLELGKPFGKVDNKEISLDKKYNINLTDIRREFDDIDDFREHYVNVLKKYNNRLVLPLPENFRTHKLAHIFDLRQPDLIARGGYFDLFNDICGKIEGYYFYGRLANDFMCNIKEYRMFSKLVKTLNINKDLYIVDGNKFENVIKSVMEDWNQEDKDIINKSYGLQGEEKKKINDISEEMNISNFSHRKAKLLNRINDALCSSKKEELSNCFYTKGIEKFVDQYFYYNDVFYTKEPSEMDLDVKNDIISSLIISRYISNNNFKVPKDFIENKTIWEKISKDKNLFTQVINNPIQIEDENEKDIVTYNYNEMFEAINTLEEDNKESFLKIINESEKRKNINNYNKISEKIRNAKLKLHNFQNIDAEDLNDILNDIDNLYLNEDTKNVLLEDYNDIEKDNAVLKDNDLTDSQNELTKDNERYEQMSNDFNSKLNYLRNIKIQIKQMEDQIKQIENYIEENKVELSSLGGNIEEYNSNLEAFKERLRLKKDDEKKTKEELKNIKNEQEQLFRDNEQKFKSIIYPNKDESIEEVVVSNKNEEIIDNTKQQDVVQEELKEFDTKTASMQELTAEGNRLVELLRIKNKESEIATNQLKELMKKEAEIVKEIKNRMRGNDRNED